MKKKNIKCDVCDKETKKDTIYFDNKYFCCTDCYFKYLSNLDRKKIIRELAN